MCIRDSPTPKAALHGGRLHIVHLMPGQLQVPGRLDVYKRQPEHWMTLLAKTYEMWLQPVVIEPADFKKIQIPVLVMAGDHDFSPVEDNAEIFRDLPHGQLIIVPASNHGTFNKRPELVNLAMREFLDQPDNSAPSH